MFDVRIVLWYKRGETDLGDLPPTSPLTFLVRVSAEGEKRIFPT